VKLLFDENLSPSLVRLLSDLFPDSRHVHDCQLGGASDDQIWEYAVNQGLTIVSKDFDFYDRSVLLGTPPKLIWLRAGNSSTTEIERLIWNHSHEILGFEIKSEEAFLILP
jgi:predicted nuclease of predicted toxin-antitoxin system